MFYWFCHVFLRFVSFFLFPMKVVGRENVPGSGGFILASNHLSNLDPVILALSIHRRLSFVAKDTLFKKKLFSMLIKSLGAFPIKREAADIGAIKESIRRLKSGLAVLIFPEGTRIKDKAHREVQSGIGMIAVKAGVPIVPVHLSGTDIVLPEGAKFFKRHIVTIHIGKPLQTSSERSYQDIAFQTMSQIDELAC